MKLLEPLEFEAVSRADARRELVGPPPTTVAIDWSGRRIARNEETLRPSTTQWIEGLSAEIRPVELAKQYVRIANKLAALWNDPMHCTPYLSDLMIVRRGSRKGFPPRIAMEIGALNVHYATLHPPGRPWN